MLASHSSCVWEHGYSSLYSTRVIPWVFDDDEVLYLIHKSFIVHQFVLKPVIQRECCSVHQQLIYYVDFILFVCSFSLMMYQMLLWWLYTICCGSVGVLYFSAFSRAFQPWHTYVFIYRYMMCCWVLISSPSSIWLKELVYLPMMIWLREQHLPILSYLWWIRFIWRVDKLPA